MKISKEDFNMWKNDYVTKEFFLAIESLRDNINEQLLSDSIISSSQGHLMLNRLAGIREGLNQVLFASGEDFCDDEEESETSRV